MPGPSLFRLHGSPIRALTFDVGGTLLECWPSVGHIYAQAAARYGAGSLSPALLNRRFSAVWRKLRGFHHGRPQWAALVDATFAGLVCPPPSQSFFAALYQRFAQAGAWHVFEDVWPRLRALKTTGFKLGIISNWDDRLPPLLRKLGLASYFDVVTISYEVGATKPSSAIFHAAARRLELPCEHILHVGDSEIMDVAGARAAGFKAVQLKRARRPQGRDKISSLWDLVE